MGYKYKLLGYKRREWWGELAQRNEKREMIAKRVEVVTGIKRVKSCTERKEEGGGEKEAQRSGNELWAGISLVITQSLSLFFGLWKINMVFAA